MFMFPCIQGAFVEAIVLAEPVRKDNTDKLHLLYGSLQSDAEDRQHIGHYHDSATL